MSKFINCPSCEQRNPTNAKTCLHCNYPMRPGEDFSDDYTDDTPGFGGSSVPDNFFSSNRRSRGGRQLVQGKVVRLSFRENPIATTLLTIFAVAFLGFVFYRLKNAPPRECTFSKSRVAMLQSKGYTCTRGSIFDEAKHRDEHRVYHPATDTRYEMCCVLEEPEEPEGLEGSFE